MEEEEPQDADVATTSNETTERSIDTLDYTDRRLFQACTNNNVAFIWPNSTSRRSVDEERTRREERRSVMRTALSNSRNQARDSRGLLI